MAYPLEHVGIVASPATVGATRAFYVDVFGWHVLRESASFVFVGDGTGGRLELLIQDSAPVAAPNHPAFLVPMDEFDAVLAKIRATGVPVDEPITNELGRLVFFADPSGNRVQIVARKQAMAM